MFCQFDLHVYKRHYFQMFCTLLWGRMERHGEREMKILIKFFPVCEHVYVHLFAFECVPKIVNEGADKIITTRTVP